MFTSILSYINDEKKFYSDLVSLCTINFNDLSQDPNGAFVAETLDDPSEFIKFAEKNIPYLVNKAFNHESYNIDLSEIKQVYELIGLYVDRCIIKIVKDGSILAYAVCESYSPGLNLFNILDSIRVYVVGDKDSYETILDSILHEASYFYSKYNKSNAYLFIHIDENECSSLSVSGLKYYTVFRRIFADKTGGVEYKNLLLNMAR